MKTKTFKRKLAAILSADVVGYSRLMGADEAATVTRLTAYRTVICSQISKHNGTVLDAKGDNLLAEFNSVVDAVNCAVRIQEALAEKNRGLAANRMMQFRIGINLGDVIEQDETIYGDGVNIAARLEGLAAPGGICISKSVVDQVENKLPFHFVSTGRHAVKNISKPVFTYRVDYTSQQSNRRRKLHILAGKKSASYSLVGLLCGCLILAVTVFFHNRNHSSMPDGERPVDKRLTEVPLKVPSLAIYPFDFRGRSAAANQLSESMSSSIFSTLSRISGIEAILVSAPARDSSTTGSADNQRSSHGTQYFLAGNVTDSNSDLIFNIHLNDRTSGIIWSESYSCDRKSMYIIQNDILWRILSHLNVKLTAQEKQIILAAQHSTAESKNSDEPNRKKEPARANADLKTQVLFWESIMDADSKGMYEEYLKQFPDGIFRQLAHKKIKMLSVKEVNPEQKSTKVAGKEIAGPRKSTSADYELVFWQSIEKSMNIELFSDYLRRFPEGLFVSIASARIDELKKVQEIPLSKTVSAKPKIDLQEAVQAQSKAATYSSGSPLKVAVLPGHFDIGSPYLTSDIEGRSCQAITDEMKEYSHFQIADRFCGTGDQQHYKKIIAGVSNKQNELWLKQGFPNRETPNMDLVRQLGRLTDADAGLLYSVHLDFPYGRPNEVNIWLVDLETGKLFFKNREIFYYAFESDIYSALADILFEFATQKFQSDGQRESICWDIIKNWDRPEAYRMYLKLFPDGKFSGIAKLKSENWTPRKKNSQIERTKPSASADLPLGPCNHQHGGGVA